MERVVKIEIIVDLENPKVVEWQKVTDFFESEVEEVLEKVGPYGQRGYSKYQSEFGTTKNGSKFKLTIRKRKKKIESA